MPSPLAELIEQVHGGTCRSHPRGQALVTCSLGTAHSPRMATIQDHETTPGCYPRGFSGEFLESEGRTGDIGLLGLMRNQEVAARIRVAYAMTRVIQDGRRLGILI